MINAAAHGFILALGLILPLGVQNIFIFNQGALQHRMARVLPGVITAALCDTLLISLAVLGVSTLVLGNGMIKFVLLTAGIVFLIYMGIVTWRSRPADRNAELHSFSPKKQIVFAASVSLLNPHAIMDTIGVIGTSSLSYSDASKLAFTVSCICVSWLWFLGLAVAGRQTGRLDTKARFIPILNKVSGLIMIGTAMYLVTTLF